MGPGPFSIELFGFVDVALMSHKCAGLSDVTGDGEKQWVLSSTG